MFVLKNKNKVEERYDCIKKDLSKFKSLLKLEDTISNQRNYVSPKLRC